MGVEIDEETRDEYNSKFRCVSFRTGKWDDGWFRKDEIRRIKGRRRRLEKKSEILLDILNLSAIAYKHLIAEHHIDTIKELREQQCFFREHCSDGQMPFFSMWQDCINEEINEEIENVKKIFEAIATKQW